MTVSLSPQGPLSDSNNRRLALSNNIYTLGWGIYRCRDTGWAIRHHDVAVAAGCQKVAFGYMGYKEICQKLIASSCRYINVSRKVKSGTTLAGWLNVDRSTSNGGERAEAWARNRNIGRPSCYNCFPRNIIIHAGCHCSQMLSECCDAKWAGTSEGGQEKIQISLNCARNSFRQCNLCMSQQATSTASSINNRLSFFQANQLVLGNVYTKF